MSQETCIFCKIISGEIPSTMVFEDEICVAFNDITPQAPNHLLIVPRQHFASLDEADESHQEVLGHMLLTCAKIAREQGFSKKGYRTVINTNDDGGQTVFHLHIHLLGGRQFIFPPG
jgi:histidine triad (HIT) family protein